MESPEQSSSKPQYFQGYPLQYREAQILEVGCAIFTVTPFLVVIVGGVFERNLGAVRRADFHALQGIK